MSNKLWDSVKMLGNTFHDDIIHFEYVKKEIE